MQARLKTLNLWKETPKSLLKEFIPRTMKVKSNATRTYKSLNNEYVVYNSLSISIPFYFILFLKSYVQGHFH